MDDERKLYLPYLLNALWEASFEGTLTLMEGDVERTVFFHGGKPVNVRSRLQEETLGRILLEEGRISKDDYNRMLDLMVRNRRPAGEILISMGALGPQDVFLALEFQTKKKLLNCFKMIDFGFSAEKVDVPPGSLIAHLDPAEIIFSGVQSAYSVDRLLTEFPVDEETVFIARPSPDNRPVQMGPRESKIHRSIGSGNAMVKLMNKESDLHHLISVLYAMHALKLLDASSVARPSTRDLELPGVEDESAPPARQAAAEPVEVIEIEIDDEPFRAPTLHDVLESNGVDADLAKKVLSLARANHFEVLEVDPGAQGQALKNAFFRLLRTHKLQDIEAAYLSPKDRDLAHQLLDRATIAYRELDDEKSRQEYRKAIQEAADPRTLEVSPRILADVEAQKGDLALGAKRYDEARELYTEAIRLYPEDPAYYHQLGLAIYLKAMEETPVEKALPDSTRKPFLKAVAMNPRYDQPRLYLGYISKRNGDFKRALQEFQGALECNPANKRARSEIRILKKRMEDQ